MGYRECCAVLTAALRTTPRLGPLISLDFEGQVRYPQLFYVIERVCANVSVVSAALLEALSVPIQCPRPELVPVPTWPQRPRQYWRPSFFFFSPFSSDLITPNPTTGAASTYMQQQQRGGALRAVACTRLTGLLGLGLTTHKRQNRCT